MFMPSMFLFFLVLVFSVFLVISSPTWLGAWVGLEVNLMRFIPIILDRRNMLSVECCLKYFLVQAFSSLILLTSLLIIMGELQIIWIFYGLGSIGGFTALLIKLGAAPFHFWFPAVSGGIGWIQNFFLITVQKLGPLVLIGYTITLS
jgi:NADH-ubiquinone oxidoreductase chain 2